MKKLIMIISVLLSLTALSDNLTLISLQLEYDAKVTEIKNKYDKKRTTAGDKLVSITTKYRDLYLEKNRVDEAVYLSNVLTRKYTENAGLIVPKEYADINTKFDKHLETLNKSEAIEIDKVNQFYIEKCNEQIKSLIASQNMADMREVKEFRDQLKAGTFKVEKSVLDQLHGKWIRDPTDSNKYQMVYIFTKNGETVKWVRYIGSSSSDVTKQAGKVKVENGVPIIWGNLITRIDNNRIHIGNTSIEEGGIVISRLTDESILRFNIEE